MFYSLLCFFEAEYETNIFKRKIMQGTCKQLFKAIKSSIGAIYSCVDQWNWSWPIMIRLSCSCELPMVWWICSRFSLILLVEFVVAWTEIIPIMIAGFICTSRGSSESEFGGLHLHCIKSLNIELSFTLHCYNKHILYGVLFKFECHSICVIFYKWVNTIKTHTGKTGAKCSTIDSFLSLVIMVGSS